MDMSSVSMIQKTKKRLLKTFLTVGPTRMGKSSLINSLAGKPICVVGKAFGKQESTTTQIRAFQFDIDNADDEFNYTVQIIDTIGFWDTRCAYTDNQICEMIMEELIGGGGNLEVINLDKNEGVVRQFQAPDQIDGILLLEIATGHANCTNQTFQKAAKILGGVEAKDSMILIISNYKKALQEEGGEENVQGRIDEAKELELGGALRWESVNVTPEEM